MVSWLLAKKKEAAPSRQLAVREIITQQIHHAQPDGRHVA